MPPKNRPELLPQQDLSASTLAPLPFYPNLRFALGSSLSALLLAHFERDYPETGAPVLVEFGRIQRAFRLRRPVLAMARANLCVWYPSIRSRLAAQRAQREFYGNDGRLRPYSLACISHALCELRRHHGFLAALLGGDHVLCQRREALKEAWTPEFGDRVSGQLTPLLPLQIVESMPLGPEAAAGEMERKLRGLSAVGQDRRVVENRKKASAGGKARAKKLSPARRLAISRMASLARWKEPL